VGTRGLVDRPGLPARARAARAARERGGRSGWRRNRVAATPRQHETARLRLARAGPCRGNAGTQSGAGVVHRTDPGELRRTGAGARGECSGRGSSGGRCRDRPAGHRRPRRAHRADMGRDAGDGRRRPGRAGRSCRERCRRGGTGCAIPPDDSDARGFSIREHADLDPVVCNRTARDLADADRAASDCNDPTRRAVLAALAVPAATVDTDAIAVRTSAIAGTDIVVTREHAPAALPESALVFCADIGSSTRAIPEARSHAPDAAGHRQAQLPEVRREGLAPGRLLRGLRPAAALRHRAASHASGVTCQRDPARLPAAALSSTRANPAADRGPA
jgi:hypothetical protein